jgi:hypothetical protein
MLGPNHVADHHEAPSHDSTDKAKDDGNEENGPENAAAEIYDSPIELNNFQ